MNTAGSRRKAPAPAEGAAPTDVSLSPIRSGERAKVVSLSTVLETFPAPSTCRRVRFTSDELTSLCPLTGQPDFNTIEIDYAPNLLCIESKSLKLYLWSFRDKGAFVEQLAAEIAAEVQQAVEPVRVRVTITQHARGGIVTEATAELPPFSTQ